MALQFHPRRGTLVRVAYEPGFKAPEMVKRRLAVVISPPISQRKGLLTVVALSTTPPKPVMPYHLEIDIPFDLPHGWASRCWVKGDMVNTVGFHRTDLLHLGREGDKRRYQTETLSDEAMEKILHCLLQGLGARR